MKKVEDISQCDLNDVVNIKIRMPTNDWNFHIMKEQIEVFASLIKCGNGYEFYTTQKGTEKISKILRSNGFNTHNTVGYWFDADCVYVINRKDKLKRILNETI